MNMQASDLSARLLATENLSVVRANTHTASFDIKSRVLTLPLWKEMTPDVEDMLIGHEVGHALYTTDKYVEPIRENPKLMGYMNIIEDVRIEKLIKRKYPGLRKRMNEGYKQLNERDFFGVKSIQDLNELLLIDKINLYFKVGFNCGVTFTPDEKAFVNRAERTETVEEVIQLAKEIYEYSREQAEQKKLQTINIPEDGEIDSDAEFDEMDDAEFEESDETIKIGKSSRHNEEQSTPDSEPDLESKTERAFKSKLDDLADTNTEYYYWEMDDCYYDNPLVSYKKVLSQTKSVEEWNSQESSNHYHTRYMSQEQIAKHYSELETEYNNFKKESVRTVNYLVKEFEMKKSATLYKRAQSSKIGSLDMKKIYSYKLQDDLFKRVTTLPQGKNHGMVMLLDWSGSMNRVLIDTLKQVINLAMFCQRTQIPYQVLAFTTGYDCKEYMTQDEIMERNARIREMWEANRERTGNILSNAQDYNLLELFSSKMTVTEFNSMAKRVLDYRFTSNSGYGTSSTPLNESLVWVYQNLGNFIKANNIEKTTLITLTDGAGCGLHQATRSGVSLDAERSVVKDGQYKKVKMRHFIKDKFTQKTYELTRDSTKQTELFLRMIKDRYNVASVGFYICRNHRSDLISAARTNIPDYNGDVHHLIDTWKKAFRQDSYTTIKNTGRDELFLIPQESTRIDDGELEVDANSKASSIARHFSKYLNTKRTSRILLNKFVTLIA